MRKFLTIFVDLEIKAAGEDIPDGLAAKLLHHGQDTETQKMIKYTLGSFYAGMNSSVTLDSNSDKLGGVIIPQAELL